MAFDPNSPLTKPTPPTPPRPTHFIEEVVKEMDLIAYQDHEIGDLEAGNYLVKIKDVEMSHWRDEGLDHVKVMFFRRTVEPNKKYTEELAEYEAACKTYRIELASYEEGLNQWRRTALEEQKANIEAELRKFDEVL
jgi:hypothetical protein